MSISIVTVTYNSSKNLLAYLMALEQQYYSDKFELIIVDNNSSDKKIVKSILNEYKSIKSNRIKRKFLSENLGFAAGCNYGASFAKYEYILFLNPDTILPTNSLKILEEHAKKHRANIAGGKCTFMTDRSKIHNTVYYTPSIRTLLFEFSNLGKLTKFSGRFYYDQEAILNDTLVDGLGGAYLLIKKISFKKLKGFDSNMFMYLEDVDLCTRAKLDGMKIVYCPHSLVNHIGGASSNNKYKIHHNAWYKSREYYAKKHFPTYISFPIIIMYKIERMVLEIRRSLSPSA